MRLRGCSAGGLDTDGRRGADESPAEASRSSTSMLPRRASCGSVHRGLISSDVDCRGSAHPTFSFRSVVVLTTDPVWRIDPDGCGGGPPGSHRSRLSSRSAGSRQPGRVEVGRSRRCRLRSGSRIVGPVKTRAGRRDSGVRVTRPSSA